MVLVVLGLVVLLVSAPLRTGRDELGEAVEEAERAELEAAREAKYAEIRDAELDFRTGKLSEAEWRAQDRVLRGEAVELLRRLDELDERRGVEGGPRAGDGDPELGDHDPELGDHDPELGDGDPEPGARGAGDGDPEGRPRGAV